MLSRLSPLTLRLVGSAEWRPSGGMAWLAGIGLLYTAGYAAVVRYLLANPEVAPFLDPEVLKLIFWVQTRIAIPGSAVFGILGAMARWRGGDGPGTRILAHAFCQFIALVIGFFSYLLGWYTHPYGVAFLFSFAALSFVLVDVRFAGGFLVSSVVIILATTVAEWMGILPYAPLYAEGPFGSGRLTSSLLLVSSLPLLFAVVTAFFFLAVMQVARDREQKLRRATRLIRRYVPAQVASRILAGELSDAAHPERRKVSVFFSDIVGFTDAADRMEPEDLSALLNEYLSEMAAIADSFDATVNQFVGDGIMIFFGAPEATNDRDHALRSVRMALAMQRRMGELGGKWFDEGIESPFRIRIGINTGVASVGEFGSEGRTTYSAIGNQTNLTARIQAHCQPGRVLISHTTWALVKDEIPCQERGEIEVKGLHYPVRVYEVDDGASAAPCDDGPVHNM